MNCRNCKNDLFENIDYCQFCGAKVIKERITLKKLKNDFLNDFLGLDNVFFSTLITMLISPYKVSTEYISGTRKMFIQPFAFLAIGMTIATIIYNSFSEQYTEMNSSVQNESFLKTVFEIGNKGKHPKEYYSSPEYDLDYKKYKDDQIEVGRNSQRLLLKYFNIFVFLCLPFYTFIAYKVFGKKHFNYGEHLVINAYLLGFGMILVSILFLLGIFLYPAFYYLGGFVVMFYYLWTYRNLNQYSLEKTILKFLRFLFILLTMVIVIMILAIIILVILKLVFGK